MQARSSALVLIVVIEWVAFQFFTVSANAAEWSTEPSLRLGYEQNDNPKLSLESHNSISATTVAPKLDMGVRSEIWEVTGSAEHVQKRYTGETDLDRDDNLYKLSSSYKTERNTVQLNGSRTIDSTLNEQLTSDFGLVQSQKRRETRDVNPTWTWAISERSQAQLTYDITHVSYVDGQSVGLNDYSVRAASLRLANQFSMQSQIFMTLGYSHFYVPTIDLESFGPNGQLGIAHSFSETLQGTLAVGARKTSTNQTVQTCTAPNIWYELFGIPPACLVPLTPKTLRMQDTNYVFNSILKKKFENASMNISYNRSLDPSGVGKYVEADVLSVWVDRPVTPKITANLFVNVYTTRVVQGSSNGSDRKFFIIEPRVRWSWVPECNLELAYRYTHLKRDFESDAAESRSITATVIYQWTKMSISR